MSEWSDKKKFWCETGRSLLLPVLGGFIVLWFLNPQGAVNGEKLKFKTQAINDFLTTGYSYTSKVYDICKANKEKDSICIYPNFQKVYDDYRIEQNRMLVFFEFDSVIKSKLDTVEEKSKLLKSYFFCPERAKAAESIRKSLKTANNEVAKAALDKIELFKINPYFSWK